MISGPSPMGPVTGAFQLSGGFVLNAEQVNFKVVGEIDLFRAAIALVRDDESQEEDSRFLTTALPFQGWGIQTSLASSIATVTAEFGYTRFGSETKEGIWRGGVELTVNNVFQMTSVRVDSTYRGMFWAAGGSGSKSALEIHGGIGFKTW